MLSAGTRLGPYQIESPLGAGGMGEVYKARDTRLDRSVAIKILSSELAADPDFRERFDREARAISRLSHPNICTLHDVGQESGTAYLVMELLDGQTLAARIAKGALPPSEALQVAIQIGEALVTAHRAGLVHRDLKPGNVMLTRSGAKLLDFGLVKGTLQGPGATLTIMPTTPAAMTAQGAIVGTFQYMAPEQIEGGEADARTDIFAFGCILYEMLAGRPAFEGKTQASLIGAIMHAEPVPVSRVAPLAPAGVDRIVQKCLAKDPDARWQTARDLVDELRWLTAGGAAEAGSGDRTTASAPSRLPWVLAGASMLLAAALGIRLMTARSGPEAAASASVRFTLTMPESAGPSGAPASLVSLSRNLSTMPAAVSRDGKHLVFVGAVRGDRSRLWLRPLDALEAHAIPNTENATTPIWSPDGQSIAYFDHATRQLKKTTLTGDRNSVICELAVPPQGAHWGPDDTIVYGTSSGIVQMPASGGPPVAVSHRTPGQAAHFSPQFLKDGRHVLFGIFGAGLFVTTIDGSDLRQVTRTSPSPFVVLDDDVVVRLEGTSVVGQRFDSRTFTFTGEPTPIIANVASFTAASSILAYTPQRSIGTDELFWLDRTGRRVGTLGDRAAYSNVELSPDASRVAVAVLDPGLHTRDIWVYDVARGVRQRFTFSEGEERTPVWSPDGSRILYNVRSSASTTPIEFYQKAADGSGKEEPVLVDGLSKDALGWTPDGRYLLYRVTGGATGNDLLALPMFGERHPFAVAATPFDEPDGSFSPDGRWVAYTSNESGELEVYVCRFPSLGGKTRISTGGGSHPRWRRDGRELYYLSLDSQVVAVDVTLAADSIRLGGSRPLFATYPPVQFGYNYDVTPDGQRFLVITDQSAAQMPVVVTNWRSLSPNLK